MIEYEGIRPKLERPTGTGVVLNTAGVRDAPTLAQIAAINGIKARADGITPLDLEGEPEIIDGAFALDYTCAVLRTYARWSRPEDIILTAVWIAHTWFTDLEGTLVSPASPIWLVVAPPESGKSRKLKLVNALSRNPTGVVQGLVTAPGVRNAKHAKQTVILDEGHRIFGKGGRREDLQGILTGGYTPDNGTLNGQSGTTQHDIFGAVAMGAQPRIITGTGDMLEDLFLRCFTIWSEASEDDIPDLTDQFRQSTELGRNILGLWAAQERPAPGDSLWPIHTVPSVLKSRKREISLGLFAIADRAIDPGKIREEGSDPRWAIMTRNAVKSMLLGRGEPEQVMADLRAMYESMGGNDVMKELEALAR